MARAHLGPGRGTARARGAWICCADESGLSLAGLICDNLILARLICYHPDGRRARPLAGHVVGAYTTAALIALLQRLPALLDGAPVILVWDQLPAHHTTDMKTWLAEQTHWL